MIDIFAKKFSALVTREIKCSSCGKWTPGSESHCIFCGHLTDPVIIAQKEREHHEEARREQKVASETRFEKMMKRMQHSENPLHRVIYNVLNVIWLIYMGLITAIIWITTIFSG